MTTLRFFMVSIGVKIQWTTQLPGTRLGTAREGVEGLNFSWPTPEGRVLRDAVSLPEFSCSTMNCKKAAPRSGHHYKGGRRKAVKKWSRHFTQPAFR